MALSDLMAEARKDVFQNLDERTESNTVAKVLDLIKDQNGEVKNMSVKWCVCQPALIKLVLTGISPSSLYQPRCLGQTSERQTIASHSRQAS